MYTFCSRENCADGSLPRSAPMQASNGNFYGTTQLAGATMTESYMRLPLRVPIRCFTTSAPKLTAQTDSTPCPP